MRIQIRFIGKVPPAERRDVMAMAADMRSNDGIIVIGYDINPNNQHGLTQIIQAAATLGRAGCRHIGYIWALPF